MDMHIKQYLDAESTPIFMFSWLS